LPGTNCALRLPALRCEGHSISLLTLQVVIILRIPTHLQHAITAQREVNARAKLDRDIQALPREDHRRESWTCCDSFSSAWVSSWPSAWRGWALSPREFREVFNTYLRLPAPCVRALAGQEIQRSGPTQRFCDQYGQQLCLATLPGDSFRARHDAIATVVIGDVLRAGIPGCREPKTLFTHILPQPAGVLGRKAHCGIIPDARLRVPELAPPLAGGPRPSSSRLCNPDYLFDVKTISESATGPCLVPLRVGTGIMMFAILSAPLNHVRV
jgi:hypothetical protein